MTKSKKTTEGYLLDFDLAGSRKIAKILRLTMPSDAAEAIANAEIRHWILEALAPPGQDTKLELRDNQDHGDGHQIVFPSADLAHQAACRLIESARKATKRGIEYIFTIGIAKGTITYKEGNNYSSNKAAYAHALQDGCKPGEILICPRTFQDLAPSNRDTYDPTPRQLHDDKGEPLEGHPWHPHTLPRINLELVEAVVMRTKVLEKFMEYTRHRNVVFALGGEGGGLPTFIEQFHTYLETAGSHHAAGVDFSVLEYNKILKFKREENKLRTKHGSLGEDKLELKCLFAAFAYEVCDTLASKSPAVHQTYREWLHDSIQFLKFYFGNDAMQKSEPEPIIRHFFSTLQDIATKFGQEGLIVFMPLETLASCFANMAEKRGTALGATALALWNALDATSNCKMHYSKVCLVLCSKEFPYANSPLARFLVREALWCIPPLDISEIGALMTKACPNVSDLEAAKLLADATGGSPWLTRVVLSFVPALSAGTSSGNGQDIIMACILRAEEAIKSSGKGLSGSLKEEIVSALQRIDATLGIPLSDDTTITAVWRGRKRGRSIRISSPRIEAFVASGLILFDGDPWDIVSMEHIFAEYPTVRLREPSRLAIAAYESIRNNKDF